MSDEMKAALKALQQVIIKEYPNAVEASIRYSSGNWVDFEVLQRGGAKV